MVLFTLCVVISEAASVTDPLPCELQPIPNAVTALVSAERLLRGHLFSLNKMTSVQKAIHTHFCSGLIRGLLMSVGGCIRVVVDGVWMCPSFVYL